MRQGEKTPKNRRPHGKLGKRFFKAVELEAKGVGLPIPRIDHLEDDGSASEPEPAPEPEPLVVEQLSDREWRVGAFHFFTLEDAEYVVTRSLEGASLDLRCFVLDLPRRRGRELLPAGVDLTASISPRGWDIVGGAASGAFVRYQFLDDDQATPTQSWRLSDQGSIWMPARATKAFTRRAMQEREPTHSQHFDLQGRRLSLGRGPVDAISMVSKAMVGAVTVPGKWLNGLGTRGAYMRRSGSECGRCGKNEA